MTLQEASQRFCISMESLQLYVENGLLAGTITENGISDYKEDDLRRAVQFRFLLKAGMDAGTLKRLIHLTETEGALAEQINLLRNAGISCWKKSMVSKSAWMSWTTIFMR